MVTEGSRRAQRVASVIKATVARSLSTAFGDPILGQLVVTEVDVTSDLSLARVKVRLLSTDDSQQARDRALSHLARAQGLLRRALTEPLRLRRVPNLQFEYDGNPEASRRVEELLAEIRSESKGSED